MTAAGQGWSLLTRSPGIDQQSSICPVPSLHSTTNLISLNRLSLGRVTSPRRQSGVLPVFECHPCGLNTAAISRILVNPAVIPIFFLNNGKFVFLFILGVNISLILNIFYNTALCDKLLSMYVIRVGPNIAEKCCHLTEPV